MGCEVVGGGTEDEPEELVAGGAEDIDEVGSGVEEERVMGDRADWAVPGRADRCAAPFTGPTWKMINPASASTTMTGTAPSAMGRTLSDVRFISS